MTQTLTSTGASTPFLIHYTTWEQMKDVDIIHTIDNAFLNCQDDEECIDLWTSMAFYFTKTQSHHMCTRRACCHCTFWVVSVILLVNANALVAFSGLANFVLLKDAGAVLPVNVRNGCSREWDCD
eukprot:scaffold42839_cov98-Attheya_sp.AAC.1